MSNFSSLTMYLVTCSLLVMSKSCWSLEGTLKIPLARIITVHPVLWWNLWWYRCRWPLSPPGIDMPPTHSQSIVCFSVHPLFNPRSLRICSKTFFSFQSFPSCFLWLTSLFYFMPFSKVTQTINGWRLMLITHWLTLRSVRQFPSSDVMWMKTGRAKFGNHIESTY